MKLDESARALIGQGADATLVTINPDGSPQVSVVWVALQSSPSPSWVRRLPDSRRRTCRSPGPRIVEGGAPELLTELAEAMLGSSEHFPPTNAPAGLLTRIHIDKVGGIGPWAS
ncbi:MAG: hypothetical protein QOE74_5999 [Mycobacterium sp.]|jgi:hypothetical protein|nr:hypothetical protein [Mycobacterium sp.]